MFNIDEFRWDYPALLRSMTGDSTSPCSHVKHCVREGNDCFDFLIHTRKAIVGQESVRNSQNSYSDIIYTWLKNVHFRSYKQICSTMPKVMRRLGRSCGQLYQTLPRGILYIVSHNIYQPSSLTALRMIYCTANSG